MIRIFMAIRLDMYYYGKKKKEVDAAEPALLSPAAVCKPEDNYHFVLLPVEGKNDIVEILPPASQVLRGGIQFWLDFGFHFIKTPGGTGDILWCV